MARVSKIDVSISIVMRMDGDDGDDGLRDVIRKTAGMSHGCWLTG